MQVKTKIIAVGALLVLLVGVLWYRVVVSPMQSNASKANTAASDLQSRKRHRQRRRFLCFRHDIRPMPQNGGVQVHVLFGMLQLPHRQLFSARK